VADDMAAWEARLEDPVTRDYHGYTVAKTGPWGQGPAFLQALALLEDFDIAAMDPNGADFVHSVVECFKLALADREAFYGDPDFVDVPLDALMGAAHTAARRRLVGADASAELRPSRIEGHEGRLPRQATDDTRPTGLAAAGAGEPNVALLGERANDTANLNVCDRHGNMVSAMPSGGWLQSSPVIPALGFCLGTRLQMCWLEEGLASSLAPGKRPRTTLSPGLVLRDGAAYMAFGSPGGDGQDQWALQLFLRHVHHGLDLQQAIDAPAFLSSHAPSSFYPRAARPNHLELESRFGAETIAALRARGHGIDVVGDWVLGRLTAVSRKDGMIRAGANPRHMSGYAAGR
jgi:gamma-glutamyltranspeptidase/glutathione hydrolase